MVNKHLQKIVKNATKIFYHPKQRLELVTLNVKSQLLPNNAVAFIVNVSVVIDGFRQKIDYLSSYVFQTLVLVYDYCC
jgi:hypothetical protein